MKRPITLLLMLTITLLLSAQELNLERLTLEETIAYALEHAPERIRQKLLVGEAEIQLDEARLRTCPTSSRRSICVAT